MPSFDIAAVITGPVFLLTFSDLEGSD